MLLVLDTNVYCRDILMQKASFEILFAGLQRAQLTLFVPQTVVDEVVNQFQKRIQEPLNKLQREGYFTLYDSRRQFDLAGDVAEFRRYFSARLAANHAITLPLPTVSHADILARAIARTKPFNDHGKGYQDTLIWYSVLELLQMEAYADQQVVFVSTNTKDFAAPNQSSLHEQLRADLAERNIAAERCIYLTSLSQLIKQHVRPTLDTLDSAVEQLAARGVYNGLDVLAWLQTAFLRAECQIGDELQYVEGAEANERSVLRAFLIERLRSTVRHDYGSGSALVAAIDVAQQFTNIWSAKLNNDELLINFDVALAVELTLSIDQTYAYDPAAGFRIMENDWSSWYVSAGKTVACVLSMRLVLGPPAWDQVKSFEIVDIVSKDAQHHLK